MWNNIDYRFYLAQSVFTCSCIYLCLFTLLMILWWVFYLLYSEQISTLFCSFKCYRTNLFKPVHSNRGIWQNLYRLVKQLRKDTLFLSNSSTTFSITLKTFSYCFLLSEAATGRSPGKYLNKKWFATNQFDSHFLSFYLSFENWLNFWTVVDDCFLIILLKRKTHRNI